MVTYLVTGGMGFIGSNFIMYLLKNYKDIRIINFDALTYAGNPDNLQTIWHDSRYQFVHGNIQEPQSIQNVFHQGVDVVVHFAAESHVDRSIHHPDAFVQTNVVGTFNLLEAARCHPIKAFIHVSTDEVYGSLGSEGYFTEATPLAPNSPYSASKASSDLLVRSYVETYGLPALITRCSNNYGPRQFPEKLIPLVIMKAMQDESIPIYGDGKNVRDWLYVEDHCSAIDLVSQKGSIGEVYNIGGHNEYTNLDIVMIILKQLGKSEKLITFVSDRLGHDRRYAIDPTKVRELGWRPSTAFPQGIEKTIEWYAEHSEWLERIRTGQYRGEQR